MKILLIGSQSVLAKYLEQRLAQFAEVHTAGRSSGTIHLDLLAEDIKIEFQFDAIIILAAHYGGENIDDCVNALSTNVLGPLKIIKAASEARAKHLIFISSVFSQLDPESPAYNIYGISKRHAEEAFTFCCDKLRMPATILKPSQLYDYRSLYRSHQPFFYDLIDKASSGTPIALFGSRDPLRNFLNVEDLTEIVARVCKSRVYGKFQSINPENISYVQLIKTVARVFGVKPEYEFLTEKKDIPDNVFKFDSQLFEEINYYPSISLEQGIRKIANFRQSEP